MFSPRINCTPNRHTVSLLARGPDGRARFSPFSLDTGPPQRSSLQPAGSGLPDRAGHPPDARPPSGVISGLPGSPAATPNCASSVNSPASGVPVSRSYYLSGVCNGTGQYDSPAPAGLADNVIATRRSRSFFRATPTPSSAPGLARGGRTRRASSTSCTARTADSPRASLPTVPGARAQSCRGSSRCCRAPRRHGC